jgi:pimeloyl-ACP methyl ester carboxylesterase
MLTEKITVRYQGREFELATCSRMNSDDLMLFIHGLGCTKENFEDVWNCSELNEASLLTFDLIGNGSSSKPADFSYSMEDHAALCRELLIHFPHQRLHLVAHSMGGAIGILLADMLDNLDTFINVEGNLIGSDCGVSRKTVSVSLEEFRDGFFEKLRHTASKQDNRGSQVWAALSKHSDITGFYRSAQSLVKLSDSGTLLKRFLLLQCKKAYIYGEENARTEVITHLQGIPTVCIPESGHFPMSDNPDEFYFQIAGIIHNTE